MAWTAFSAEAVTLHSRLAVLDKQGRISDALDEIVAALERAHREGPADISYNEFEAICAAAKARPNTATVSPSAKAAGTLPVPRP